MRNKGLLLLACAVLLLLACNLGTSQTVAVAPAQITAAPASPVPTATRAPTSIPAPASAPLPSYVVEYWFARKGEDVGKLRFGVPNAMRLGAGKHVDCPGGSYSGGSVVNDNAQTFIVRSGPDLLGNIVVENGSGHCYQDTLGEVSVKTGVVAQVSVGNIESTPVNATQKGSKVTFTGGGNACDLESPGKVCSLEAGKMVYYFKLVAK